LSTEIQKIIDKREINSVVHFSRVNNLDDILAKGVIPRSKLPLNSFVFNDNVRADGKLDHSSFSISFPNHLMLYRLRCNLLDSQWAILIFDSRVLKDFDCLFYPVNAASSIVNELPLENFKGSDALEAMFTYNEEEREGFLLEKDPTDVQAEVMISDVVPMEYLRGCVLHDKDLVTSYSKKYPDIKFVYCHIGRKIFTTRRAFRAGF
jgi:hypothetical protein